MAFNFGQDQLFLFIHDGFYATAGDEESQAPVLWGCTGRQAARGTQANDNRTLDCKSL